MLTTRASQFNFFLLLLLLFFFSLGDSVKRLNEIMMKENCQPIYELIPCVNKDGFIYKVICGSRVAMGKPASYIHRAKNNAANEMLSRIEYNFADSNYTDDDSSLKVNKTSSSPISPSVKNNVITDVQHSDLGVTNYVGALQVWKFYLHFIQWKLKNTSRSLNQKFSF